MELKQLELDHFRNYTALSASFDPGVNLILGDNAQGKTNLLEAVSFLSGGRSWRARREQELIQFDAPFAELRAEIFTQERDQTIRIQLFPDRRPRRIFVGEVKQRSGAALDGLLASVLFCPEDLSILKSGAQGRRRFLDAALSQIRPNYAAAVQEYGRLYESKSRILRDGFEKPSLYEALPEFSQRMAQVGAIIIRYRARYLAALDEAARGYCGAFSGGREELRLAYQTVSTVSDPLAPTEVLYGQLMDHLASHERAERETGQCLTGPHKDDFETTLDGLSVKTYGSQGQTRTAAISLKLSERELLRRELDEEPLLLLDDVLSELDPARQDFVLNQIQSGQVFITCCEAGKLTSLGKVMHIAAGTLLED